MLPGALCSQDGIHPARQISTPQLCARDGHNKRLTTTVCHAPPILAALAGWQQSLSFENVFGLIAAKHHLLQYSLTARGVVNRLIVWRLP